MTFVVLALHNHICAGNFDLKNLEIFKKKIFTHFNLIRRILVHIQVHLEFLLGLRLRGN